MSATAMPYPNVHSCLGNEVGRFHHRYWWYATGQPRAEFEAVLKDLKAQVDATLSEDYYSFVHFHLFMIGRVAASAKPTIMFFCEKKEPRKKAKDAVDKGGLLDRLPGFRTGHQATQPEIGTLIQPATEGDLIVHSEQPVLHRDVYWDPSSEIKATGMPIYVKHRNGNMRKAIAYAYRKDNECMLLSVSHVFREYLSDQNDTTTSDDEDYDFGSGSEDEATSDNEVAITSSGSMSSLDDLPGEDVTKSTSHESASSALSGRASPQLSHSLEELNLAAAIQTLSVYPESSEVGQDKANSMPLEIEPDESSFKRLGILRFSSVDEDWALIKITNFKVFSELQKATVSFKFAAFQILAEAAIETFCVINNADSTKSTYGCLSRTSTYMRLPGSSTYQELYQVWMDEPIRRGESGALVLDTRRKTSYGHIVASSATGDAAFIMPASRMYESITTQLQAFAAVSAVSVDPPSQDQNLVMSKRILESETKSGIFSKRGRSHPELPLQVPKLSKQSSEEAFLSPGRRRIQRELSSKSNLPTSSPSPSPPGTLASSEFGILAIPVPGVTTPEHSIDRNEFDGTWISSQIDPDTKHDYSFEIGALLQHWSKPSNILANVRNIISLPHAHIVSTSPGFTKNDKESSKDIRITERTQYLPDITTEAALAIGLHPTVSDVMKWDQRHECVIYVVTGFYDITEQIMSNSHCRTAAYRVQALVYSRWISATSSGGLPERGVVLEPEYEPSVYVHMEKEIVLDAEEYDVYRRIQMRPGQSFIQRTEEDLPRRWQNEHGPMFKFSAVHTFDSGK